MAPGNGSANGVRVVKLTKPLAGHGGQIHELKLQPITARVYMKNKKAPFEFEPIPGTDRFRISVSDYGLVVQFLSDISGIDPIVLEDMSSEDLASATVALKEMVLGSGN